MMAPSPSVLLIAESPLSHEGLFWQQKAASADIPIAVCSNDSGNNDFAFPATSPTLVVDLLSSSVGETKILAIQKVIEQYGAELLILSASHDGLVTQLLAKLGTMVPIVGFSPFHTNPVDSSGVTLCLPKQAEQAPFSKIWAALAENHMGALGLQVRWIRETPGMVVGRVYAMLVNEAAFALQEGVATPQAIDTAMRLGTNYPIGPLAWADLVGIDTVLSILNHLWTVYHEPRYRPCIFLQQMVMARQLGQKTCKGFFEYTPQAEVLAMGKEKVT